MKIKSVNFSQLSDIMAFTIQEKNVDLCYKVLGLLHQHYSYVPGRLKIIFPHINLMVINQSIQL